ncbi:hypothetical protein ACFL5F_04760 [Planctomycetota bacterium]
MKLSKSIGNCCTIIFLVIFLTTVAPAGNSERKQNSQENSQELLLKIMDLHSDLVTNDVFLAQAKLLGGYVEAAQQLDENKKIEVYTRLLNILSKIKNSPVSIAAVPTKPPEATEGHSTSKEQDESKSVYEPGAALLEIYKTDSIEIIPSLPVIRTYWKRDLAHSGGFLLPDRMLEIGYRNYCVARFSFYYEAKWSGKYGFVAVLRGNDGLGTRDNASCKLTIGGVDVLRIDGRSRQSVEQGSCNIQKGFHRIEFLLGGRVDRYKTSKCSDFEVKILSVGAFDAVPLTKDMMLLKSE